MNTLEKAEELYNKLSKEEQKLFLIKKLKEMKEEKGEEEVNEVLTGYYDLPGNVKYSHPVFVTEAKALKFAGYNRNLIKTTLNKLKDAYTSQKSIGNVKEIPVLVYYDREKECFVLIDGHHRVHVLSDLDSLAYFTVYGLGRQVSKEEAQLIMSEINKIHLRWLSKNYDESFVNDGNENYVQARLFIDKYKDTIPTDTLRCLLMGYYKGCSNGPIKKFFDEGWFTIDKNQVKFAEKEISQLIPVINACKEVGFFSAVDAGHKGRFLSFVFFTHFIYGDKFNIQHFTEMIRKYGKGSLLPGHSCDSYLMKIHDLYNNDLGKLKPISLSDTKEKSKKYHKEKLAEFRKIEKVKLPEKMALIKGIKDR